MSSQRPPSAVLRGDGRGRGRWIALLGAVCVAVSACSPPPTPMAVTSLAGVPSVVWKFCEPARGVERVVVSRVTDDEPEAWPQVWSASLVSGSTAGSQLPISDRVDGYTVETGDGWPLQPGVRYAVTDAVDTEGFSAAAFLLEFRPSELSEGDLVSHEEGEQDLEKWLGPDGPDCR